jgi:hypothetical protein
VTVLLLCFLSWISDSSWKQRISSRLSDETRCWMKQSLLNEFRRCFLLLMIRLQLFFKMKFYQRKNFFSNP